MKLTRGFVQGIMNKDLDERLLPQGQYRDGLNIGVSESSQSDVGAIENQLGNTQLSTLVGTNYFTIGAIADPANFNIYWFVTTTEPTGYDYIFRYNETTGATLTILQDTKGRVLKFDRFHVITGINIIGNLLFWTDDLNAPRRVNFTRNYGIDGFTEDDISVIVRPPLFSPTITLSDTGNDSEENNLKDTFIEFSYRYKYENDEYSAMAPFSSHAFYPSIYNYNFADWELRSMLNKFNQANVRFHLGGEQTTEVQLLFRESQSTNVNVIDSYRFPGPYTWAFNDNVQASAYVTAVGLPASAFPSNVGFTTNQVISGGFSNLDIPESFEVGDEIVINQSPGFTYSQYNGTHIIVEILDDYTFIIDVLFVGATGFEGGVATLETKEIEFINNKLYTVLPSDELGRLFDNVPLKAKAQELIGSRLAYGNYVQFFDLIDSNNQPIEIDFSLGLKSKDISGAPLPTFRSDRDYECALAYLDDYGRMTTPLVSPTNTIHIGPENSDTSNDIRLRIFNNPPAFATHFRVFIKQAKELYDNIFPLYFYQDGIARWFAIGPGDINKVKKDEYIICKTLNGGATNTVERYKVIDIEAKGKDFLNNSDSQLEGVYFKINDPDNLFNFASQFSYSFNCESIRRTNTLGGNNSIGENWLQDQDFLPDGVVNFPIFYGSSTSATSLIPTAFGGFTAHETPTLQDCGSKRWKVTVTDGVNNIFKYEALSQTGSLSLVQDNLTMLGPGTVGNEFGYFFNGVFVRICNLRFGHLPNQYTTGDYWIVNVHSQLNLILNTSISNFLPTSAGISNPFQSNAAILQDNNWDVSPINPSPNFKDRVIEAGARIEIQITQSTIGGLEQITPNQSWYSSKQYANIEEWFWMDNIQSNFSHLDLGGNNIGARNVIFRRGSDVVDNQGAQMIQAGNGPVPQPGGYASWSDKLAYGSAVRMCIINTGNEGTNTGLLPSATFIKVDFKIIQNPNVNIFETLPSLNAPNIYFETNETFKITNGVHVGNITTQATGVPAQVSLNTAQLPSATTKQIENSNFNAYCFGNGLESLRIRGGWNQYPLQYSPRASSVIDDYQQQRAEEAITYSGVYRENTGINNLNEFNLSVVNFKYLDRFFGSIQKLYSRDTDLVVFQEDKVSKVLYGKNLLSDAVGGGDIVSISQVLGTQVAFAGEYGISQNPESFAKWGNDMYFTDAQQGLVLKMPGGQGMVEVSSQGMKDYFKDMFITYPRTQKLGAFDPFKQQYVLAETNTELPCIFNVIVKPNENLGNPFNVGSQSTIICAEIEASGNWTVSLVDTGDGNNWVLINNIAGTVLSGTGNAKICFHYLSNNTLSNRSLRIDFSGCSKTVSYTSLQSKRRPIEVIGYVIGRPKPTINNPVCEAEDDLEAKQSYTFTSNSGGVIEFKNTQFKGSRIPLETRSLGLAGIDATPSPTDTVEIKAEAAGTLTQRPFSPDLGNKLRYLVSNTYYSQEEIDELVTASTATTPVLSVGTYTGSFTYSTPNNERYLYLIWDYTNVVAPGGIASLSAGREGSTFLNIEYDSASVGRSTIAYNSVVTPNRYILKYGGTVVVDTGFVAGVGSFDLIKNIKASTNACLEVQTSGVDDGWGVQIGVIAVTAFSIDLNNDDFATVCPRVPSSTKYHNGSAALPSAGDIIYDGADALFLYDGAFAYHKIGAGDDYAYIDNNGLVIDIGSCAACAETAVPVLTIPDVSFEVGDLVDLKLVGTNNPVEWAIISSCQSYLITGNSTGGVYTLSRCDGGGTFEAQVGAGSSRVFCSSSTPVLVTGSASTAVSEGVCQGEVLPPGLSIDSRTGFMSGSPTTAGRYRIVVTATNCFGTSVNTAFIITIGETTSLRRFNMDTSNPEKTTGLVCAITPSYNVYYHDGGGAYPAENNTVYQMSNSGSYLPYNGGYLWFLMDNNTAIRIEGAGVVVDESMCATTKTTEGGYDKTTELDLDKTIE